MKFSKQEQLVFQVIFCLIVFLWLAIPSCIEESEKKKVEESCYADNNVAGKITTDYKIILQSADDFVASQQLETAAVRYREANAAILSEIDAKTKPIIEDAVEAKSNITYYTPDRKARRRAINSRRRQEISVIEEGYRPIRAEVAYKLGFVLQSLGKKREAVSCYTDSLNRSIAPPNDGNARLNRGDLYLQLGDKKKALEDFQEASNLYSKNPEKQQEAASRIDSVK